MTSSRQQTIQTTATVSGPLLHAPGHATVVLSPAPGDTGLVFIRRDLPGKPHIPCRPENAEVHGRWMTVRQSGASISVVEHLLAACHGLGIDNLFISVDSDGVPMPDAGSAKPFVDAMLDAGIIRQAKPRNFLTVNRPIYVTGISGSHVIAVPGTGFEVAYMLEYPDTTLEVQAVKFDVNPDEFIREIAPARSFITSWETPSQFGPAINEVPVIYPDRIFAERLPQEATRHKALDLIGDLALLGRPVRGSFVGTRSGHRLNREFVLSLADQGQL